MLALERLERSRRRSASTSASSGAAPTPTWSPPRRAPRSTSASAPWRRRRRSPDRIASLEPVLDGARLEIRGGVDRPPLERTAGVVALHAQARADRGGAGIRARRGGAPAAAATATSPLRSESRPSMGSASTATARTPSTSTSWSTTCRVAPRCSLLSLTRPLAGRRADMTRCSAVRGLIAWREARSDVQPPHSSDRQPRRDPAGRGAAERSLGHAGSRHRAADRDRRGQGQRRAVDRRLRRRGAGRVRLRLRRDGARADRPPLAPARGQARPTAAPTSATGSSWRSGSACWLRASAT